MPFIYPSKREQIQNTANRIINYVRNKDLDYNKILDFLIFEYKSPKYVCKEILDLIIKSKEYLILPNGIVTLNSQKVDIWLKEERLKKERLKEVDQEMKIIEEISKNNLNNAKNFLAGAHT
jgi:hypothetical protein